MCLSNKEKNDAKQKLFSSSLDHLLYRNRLVSLLASLPHNKISRPVWVSVDEGWWLAPALARLLSCGGEPVSARERGEWRGYIGQLQNRSRHDLWSWHSNIVNIQSEFRHGDPVTLKYSFDLWRYLWAPRVCHAMLHQGWARPRSSLLVVTQHTTHRAHSEHSHSPNKLCTKWFYRYHFIIWETSVEAGKWIDRFVIFKGMIGG